LRPYLISAGLIAFFAFFAGMFVVPKSNSSFNEFIYKYLDKKSQRQTKNLYKQINPNEYIFVSSYDPIRKSANNFTLELVQGSVYKDLRKQSADYIAAKDAPGNAIGGLSVGEPADEMYAMTEVVCERFPIHKPRYLMGVGTPINILENIALGIDMFDCVMPSRNARNGMLFTSEGTLNIKNKKWENDFSQIDPADYCFVDTDYSKAYLRHLFTVNEMLGKQIATLHNLSFYLWLVREARKHILDGDFTTWKNQMCNQMDNRL
jgi:queuine tRNA-ribosyltransferase